MNFTTRARRRGFTLIELLTVIAIIGILAAIIIPVVGKVRQSARSANNVSNLRQLALAANLHARENRDFFPEPGLRDENQKYPAQIFPYMSAILGPGDYPEVTTIFGPGVFQSPNREFPKSGDDIWLNGYSYGLSSFVLHSRWNRRTSAVPEPSRTILFADKVALVEVDPSTSTGDADYVGSHDGRFVAPWARDSVSSGIWASGRPAYRHGGGNGAHAAFVDGHVSLLTADQLEYDPANGSSLWQWWE